MKKKIRYQCKADLKVFRELHGMSKEEVAGKIGYSQRTLERIEKENATIDKESAMVLAKLYGLDYEQQFYVVNKKWEDWLKSKFLELNKTELEQVVGEDEYYCIYIRKTGRFQDCVFGKGMWIRNFNRNKEVRKLQKYNIKKCIELEPDIPIINKSEEWRYWYIGLTIGKIYKVLVSKKCMEECLSSCLKEVVIRRDEMFWWDDTPDIMYWGCKV